VFARRIFAVMKSPTGNWLTTIKFAIVFVILLLGVQLDFWVQQVAI